MNVEKDYVLRRATRRTLDMLKRNQELIINNPYFSRVIGYFSQIKPTINTTDIESSQLVKESRGQI
jgi:alanyl-tRNA synthetase